MWTSKKGSGFYTRSLNNMCLLIPLVCCEDVFTQYCFAAFSLYWLTALSLHHFAVVPFCRNRRHQSFFDALTGKRQFLQNNLLSRLQHLSLEAKLLDRPGKLIRILCNVRELPIITLYVNCFLCNVRELQTMNFVRPGCQSRMQWNYYITVWMITLWLLRQPCRTCFPQITVLH